MYTPGGLGGPLPPKTTQKTNISDQTGTTGSSQKLEGQFGQHVISWFQNAGTALREAWTNLPSIQDVLSGLFSTGPSTEQEIFSPTTQPTKAMEEFANSLGSVTETIIGGKEVSKMSDIEKIVYVLPHELGLPRETIMEIRSTMNENAKTNSELLAQGEKVFSLIRNVKDISIDEEFITQLTENINTVCKNNPELLAGLKEQMSKLNIPT